MPDKAYLANLYLPDTCTYRNYNIVIHMLSTSIYQIMDIVCLNIWIKNITDNFINGIYGGKWRKVGNGALYIGRS